MSGKRAEQACAIRDHVMPLIRGRGTSEPVGEGRVVMWRKGPLIFLLRMPFWKWPQAGAAPSYAPALAHHNAKPVLPYCLDVLRGHKVMSLEWSDDGPCNLISFNPGEWEAEALGLS